MAQNVNTISFNSPQAILAPDVAAEQLKLARSQQLADMLRQQAIAPIETQTVTGAGPNRAVPISPWQGLAKLGQAYFGGKLQDANDAKQLELSRQYSAQLAKILGESGEVQDAQQPQTDSIDPSGWSPNGSGLPPAGPIDPTTSTAGLNASVSDAQGPNPNASPVTTSMTNTPSARLIQTLRNGNSQVSSTSQANNFGIANLLRGQAIESIGGQGAGSAYWEQFKPTEFSKDVKMLPESMRSSATTNKFFPPVVNRGFGILTRDENGSLQNDPASMKGIEDAKRIEGTFGQPVTIKTDTGKEIQISQTEFADMQKNGGRLPLRFLPQETQDAIQKEADTSGQPANVNIKTDKGMVSGSVNPKSLGQIGVSQSPFEQALDKEEAGRVSTMKADIYDKGTHAVDKVVQNNKLLDLLPSITTGPLNKQITLLKNLGSSLGFDVGDPSSNQEFEKYAIQGALSTAKQIYGPRVTNQDVTTQIASNPGATMSEKAIYQLIKYDNDIQQRHLQKMTALDDYKGDLRRFPSWFAQKYPMEGVSSPQTGQSQNFKVETPPLVKPPLNTPSSNGAVDYYKLYGIKPK